MMLVILFIFIVSVIMYAFSRNMTHELQLDANRKILSQVSYNVDSLSTIVRNLAISLFNDRDLTVLMNNQDIEIFQLYNKLGKLDQTVNSNAFLQSITVYNRYNNCLYSTSATQPVECRSSRKPLGRDNELLGQYREHYGEIPKLRLLPLLTVDSAGIEHLHLSYFVYDSQSDSSNSSSLLMITIKPEWLFDNLRTVNGLADNTLGQIFLLDEAGAVYEQGTKSFPLSVSEWQEKMNHAPAYGYFLSKDGESKQKQIITYRTSAMNDWRIVMVQPYDAVYSRADRIRTFSILVLLLFIVLSIAASVIFSVRLYLPIGRLVQQLRLSSVRDTGSSSSDGSLEWSNDKDEWSYLSRMYTRMQSRMTELRDSSRANEHVLEQYFYRQWVEDSTSVNREQAEKVAGAAKWIESEALLVVLLKIDNYVVYQSERTDSERKLCRYAICNITEEIIGRYSSCMTVDRQNDEIVVFIQLQGTDARHSDIPIHIMEQLRQIQTVIQTYYRMTLTAAAGKTVRHYREVTSGYEEAKKHAMYRMKLGQQQIITQGMIEHSIRVEAPYISYNLDKKLLDHIKDQQLRHALQQLEEVIQQLYLAPIDQLDDEILNLTATIIHCMRQHLPHAASIVDLKSYSRRVLESETLGGVHAVLKELMEHVLQQAKPSHKPRKTEFLIGAVREIVDLNYADPNLSLQSIADTLQLSPGYLGRYYREQEGQSVADYINEIRLNHAQQLLEHQSDSIARIMEKVGYANESNFFKLFKRRTGMTPGEFRQRQASY